MKACLKKIFFTILYYFSIVDLFRFINRKKIVILVYHGVSRDRINDAIRNSAYLHIDLDNFKQHMQYLRKKYNVISLEQLCKMMTADMDMPPYTAVVTFDDGYRSVFENAFAVLQQYSIPFTIFLTSRLILKDDWSWTDKLEYMIATTRLGYINIAGRIYKLKNENLKKRFLIFIRNELKKSNEEKRNKIMEELASKLNVDIPGHPDAEYRMMNYDQLRQMDGGLASFGAHTPEHTILTLENREKVRSLIREGRQEIRNELNKEVDLFSYPNGSYNEDVKVILKEEGFQCGLTTRYGLNDKKSDLFELRRISVSSDDSLIPFIAELSGIKKYM